MRTSLVKAVAGFVLAGVVYAVPAELNFDIQLVDVLKRAVSPDNTCGALNSNYTCDATINDGGCCSQHGYCGNTTDYCGSGCQSEYGTCSNVTIPTDNTDICGPANGNLTCSDGLCCSGAGYCGNTTDYCAVSNGCQPDYGSACNSTQPLSGGTCGPTNGNATCAGDQCCSMSGYCGSTEDYCADPGNCLLGYGRCDSDATPAGASTINDPRPLLGDVTYTDDIIDCIEDNVIGLSFDDGPYNYTMQLLDLLATYNFSATFFITGNNNGKGEIDITPSWISVIQRMIADGHQVASHTWSHYSLSNITHDQRIQQMVKNEMAFNNIIGMYPTYMRPPYSDCTEESGCWADLESLGYHRIYFDLDSEDYLNPLPTEIQNSKDIVSQALQVEGVTDYLSIQHDIVEQSVTNLSSYYFDQIVAKGWKGVTVAECLGDTDRANWYRTSNASSSATSSVSAATSTATSTSAAATATSTCVVEAGAFCGTIPGFTTKAGCTQAHSSCTLQSLSCALEAGLLNVGECATYSTECAKLSSYCATCGEACSLEAFQG